MVREPSADEDTTACNARLFGDTPGPVMMPVAATNEGAGAFELPCTLNADAVRPGTEPDAAQLPATG